MWSEQPWKDGQPPRAVFKSRINIEDPPSQDQAARNNFEMSHRVHFQEYFCKKRYNTKYTICENTSFVCLRVEWHTTTYTHIQHNCMWRIAFVVQFHFPHWFHIIAALFYLKRQPRAIPFTIHEKIKYLYWWQEANLFTHMLQLLHNVFSLPGLAPSRRASGEVCTCPRKLGCSPMEIGILNRANLNNTPAQTPRSIYK